MTNSLATLALVLVLAGPATAQQKQPRRTTKASTKTAGTISPVDAARSNPSAANTHDGTIGASTGTGTASSDPSSIRTSAPATKARKKSGKSGN